MRRPPASSLVFQLAPRVIQKPRRAPAAPNTLVGRRGASFLESGYVYAPYVPLQTTPTIFGPEDFVPRKGVMTRYAKKMVRPDMYGLVVVRGLLGEEGS